MKARRVLAAVGISVLMAVSATTAWAAGWTTVTQHHDSGKDGEANATADVKKPHGIRLRIKTTKAPVITYWTETCGHKGGSATKSGKVHVKVKTTKYKTLPEIFSNDLDCLVNAEADERGTGKVVLGIQKKG